MSLQTLDPTAQEALSTMIGKLNDMLTELYAARSTTPNPSATTLTASGAIRGGSLAATNAVTGASAAITGKTASGQIQLSTGTKTATATSGAATLAKDAGVITSEALTTAAGATYTLTLTDTEIAAADQVFASVQLGSATTGMPAITTVTPGAGSVVIVVQNVHASAALNGTIKIAFMVLKN